MLQFDCGGIGSWHVRGQCGQCLSKLPKNNFTRKRKILTPLQKLLKNVGDLGIIIVATDFEKLPKVQ